MDDELLDERERAEELDYGQFLLYRMYRWGGAPLRYGITTRDFDVRFREYCRDPEHSVWCPSEVDPSLTTLQPLGWMSRAEAKRRFEQPAIEADRPLANDEFNGGAGKVWRRQLRRQKAVSAGQPVAPVMPMDFLFAYVHRYAHVTVIVALWLVVVVGLLRAVLRGVFGWG